MKMRTLRFIVVPVLFGLGGLSAPLGAAAPAFRERDREAVDVAGPRRGARYKATVRLIGDIPEGAEIVEGDILVPKGQRSYNGNPWPEGIVYFRFDSNVSGSRETKALKAMDEWIGPAKVAFVPRDHQDNYIHIRHSSDRNNSFVGMIGSEQIVNITSWGERFIIAHELGHALGFLHEQSRPDRDTYVRVIWANIEPDAEGNFCHDPLDHASCSSFVVPDTLGNPYDFESVMHYGECSFPACESCASSSCGTADGRTIVTRSGYGDYQDVMGQRDELSYWDVEDMKDVYGTGYSIYVDEDRNTSGKGTLAKPFRSLTDGIEERSGATVWIRGGTYEVSTDVFGTATLLRAHSGAVLVTAD